LKAACVALSLAVFAASAQAQMHLCKDSQGRKVYSDVPCGPDATIVNVSPASGGTSITPGASTKIEYYDVRGTTWDALAQEIQAKGPEGQWWGKASTNISYKYTYLQAANACRIQTAHVDADSTVHLPNWANRFEGSAALQAQWDNSFRSLELHERGHVQISVQSAREMERMLKTLPEQSTCGELQAKVKAEAARIYKEHDDRQAAYDAENDHGRKQWTPYR
jgi:predicted secreted Zn-dependent protease